MLKTEVIIYAQRTSVIDLNRVMIMTRKKKEQFGSSIRCGGCSKSVNDRARMSILQKQKKRKKEKEGK